MIPAKPNEVGYQKRLNKSFAQFFGLEYLTSPKFSFKN